MTDFKPHWICRIPSHALVCESEHCGAKGDASTTALDRAFVDKHSKCPAPAVEGKGGKRP